MSDLQIRQHSQLKKGCFTAQQYANAHNICSCAKINREPTQPPLHNEQQLTTNAEDPAFSAHHPRLPLGGLVGYLLGLMVAMLPLAVAGFEMRSSWRLRAVVVGVIGVMVGGAFTPDVRRQR